MPALTSEELQAALPSIPLWHFASGKLVRSWTFPDFAAAMSFVNQVAALAEVLDHHPDIDIRYNHVHLALISHDLNGITQRDLRFAASLDGKLFSEKK